MSGHCHSFVELRSVFQDNAIYSYGGHHTEPQDLARQSERQNHFSSVARNKHENKKEAMLNLIRTMMAHD